MTTSESHYIKVVGLNTHYIAIGKGPPLILLHGLGASLITWRDNLEALSKKFRVYALDLPGHGDSEKPLSFDYSMENICEFILEFMDLMKIDIAHIVGNSAGGAIGLQIALERPEKLGKLVLVDSAGLGQDVSIYIRLVTLPILGTILESSRTGGMRFMLYNVFYNNKFATEDLLEELYRSRQMLGAKEAVVKSIKNGVNLMGIRKEFLYTEKLKDLQIPSMVVWGAEDRIFPVRHAYNAVCNSPRTILKVFDRCGHWPHMEKAKEFNALLVNFLLG